MAQEIMIAGMTEGTAGQCLGDCYTLGMILTASGAQLLEEDFERRVSARAAAGIESVVLTV